MPRLFRLSNGVRLVVDNKPGNIVGMALALVGGSNRETVNTAGLAHCLEHLLLNGSKVDRQGRTVYQQIDRLGGVVNARGGKDLILLELELPSRNWSYGLELLADWFQRPVFNAALVEREKSVLMTEVTDNHNLLEHESNDWFEALAWPSHPLGRCQFGQASTIAQFRPNQLRSFWRYYQRGSRLVIAVVGPIDPDRVRAKAEALLGDLPALVQPAASESTVKLVLRRRIKVIGGFGQQSFLVLGFPTFGFADPRRLALLVLHNLFGDKDSSRLKTLIREQLGLAYSIDSSVWHYCSAGYFKITATIDNANLIQVVSLIGQELRRLKTQLVSVQEVREAVGYLAGRAAVAFNDPTHAAKFYACQVVRAGNFWSLRDFKRQLKQVKRQQLCQLANDLFQTRRLILVVAGSLSTSQRQELQKVARI